MIAARKYLTWIAKPNIATEIRNFATLPLTDLIKAARLTTRTWHEFLDDFVDDKDLVLRIKAKLPR
jgi:hypothetical protein